MPSVEELAGRVPEHEREHVRELLENALFMRDKLEETRIGLANSQVVIAYNNGGGQSGIRENPAFAAYQKLLREYRATLETLGNIEELRVDDDDSDAISQIISQRADAGKPGAVR